MIAEYFALAILNVRKRGLRSWLTILGVFIGIAAVVAIVALGQGFQKAVEDQFSVLGGDKLFIQPRGQFGPPGSSTVAVQLTLSDVRAVREVRGVAGSSYFVAGNAKLVFRGITRFYLIAGIPLDDGVDLLQEFYKVNDGRFLKKSDRRKAVVGSYYNAGNIFGKEIHVRDTLFIHDQPFEIIGILKPLGNPGDDSIVLIPEEDLREIFNIEERVDNIMVKVSGDILEVEERIQEALRQERGVKKGKEDFFILTPEEVLNTFQNVFGIVQAFIVGIAAISLLVGGIGIMNTMYTSVLERTREIGIMKAIGARNRDVLLIFLIESGLLGVVGGVMGIAAGISLAKLVEILVTRAFATTLLQTFFPWYLILGVLLFSFFIGMISGILPALQASRLYPVDALRYE